MDGVTALRGVATRFSPSALIVLLSCSVVKPDVDRGQAERVVAVERWLGGGREGVEGKNGAWESISSSPTSLEAVPTYTCMPLSLSSCVALCRV